MYNKMNFVFPIAGAGSRFKNLGYSTPKPLLKIRGHYFFEIAAKSLVSHSDNFTLSFLVLKKHCKLFEIDKKIQCVFPNAMIAIIDEPTAGAAETSYLGINKLNLKTGSLVVADCDQWIRGKNIQSMFIGLQQGKYDMAIPTFYSEKNIYSFVKCDDNGKVSKILEKVQISNRAVDGCYGFQDIELFTETYLQLKDWGTERFMSGLISEGIAKKKDIRCFELDAHVPFGTPSEYQEAILDYNLIKEIEGW